MINLYRANVISENLAEKAKDHCYTVRLKGDEGKAINVGTNALRLLRAYYDGTVTDDEVEEICRRP